MQYSPLFCNGFDEHPPWHIGKILQSKHGLLENFFLILLSILSFSQTIFPFLSKKPSLVVCSKSTAVHL